MKKKRSLKEVLALLKGKSKKDAEEIEPMEDEQTGKSANANKQRDEKKTKANSSWEGKRYKDEYEDMGTSDIQVRKRTNKHFAIGE